MTPFAHAINAAKKPTIHIQPNPTQTNIKTPSPITDTDPNVPIQQIQNQQPQT